jgi:hypothetical protein
MEIGKRDLPSSPRWALSIVLILLAGGAALAENIDPNDDGSKYAWSESVNPRERAEAAVLPELPSDDRRGRAGLHAFGMRVGLRLHLPVLIDRRRGAHDAGALNLLEQWRHRVFDRHVDRRPPCGRLGPSRTGPRQRDCHAHRDE